MSRISGAILILAASICGHGALVFLASHPQIHRYDVPKNVAWMIIVAIATSAALGLWGAYLVLRGDRHLP